MIEIETETENKIAFLPAACTVCGEYRPEEFEAKVRDILATSPELASDPEVEWVFVCGSCTARGLCPCCQTEAGDCHKAGAA